MLKGFKKWEGDIECNFGTTSIVSNKKSAPIDALFYCFKELDYIPLNKV